MITYSGLITLIQNVKTAIYKNHSVRINDTCLSYLSNSSNYGDILKYAQYSANGINELGDYFQCIKLPSTDYNLGFISINNSITPCYVGLCFNQVCSGEDLQEMLNIAQSPINFWIMTNPQNINESLSTGSISICVLLFLMVIVCLVSTLYFKLKKSKDKSIAMEIFHNFSLQKTLQIFNRPGEIKYLNGLRAISFFMVVLGHQVGTRSRVMKNFLDIDMQIEKFYITLIYSYFFSVDVFYYIGGFMIGFLFLKTYYRRPKWISFPLAIVQRLLRFWPVYLLTMFIYTKILPVSGDSPLLKASWKIEQDYLSCDGYYWSDLLFVGNFRKKICVDWAWYVQVDMQLFALSIILLSLYVRFHNKLYYHITQWLIIIGCSIICFIQCQIHQWHTNGTIGDQNQQGFQQLLYIKPWSRMNVYLLGVAIGIFYFQYTRDNIKTDYKQPYLLKFIESRIVRNGGMLLGISIVLFMICIPRTLTMGSVWPQICHSLYLSFGRLVFLFGVLLMTFPFLFGYSNFLKTFLQGEILQQIAKISFSCYMIHYIYLMRSAYNVKKSQYLGPWSAIGDLVCDLPVILIMGLAVTLFYEMPIAFCIDMIFGKKKVKKEEDIKENLIDSSIKISN